MNICEIFKLFAISVKLLVVETLKMGFSETWETFIILTIGIMAHYTRNTYFHPGFHPDAIIVEPSYASGLFLLSALVVFNNLRPYCPRRECVFPVLMHVFVNLIELAIINYLANLMLFIVWLPSETILDTTWQFIEIILRRYLFNCDELCTDLFYKTRFLLAVYYFCMVLYMTVNEQGKIVKKIQLKSPFLTILAKFSYKYKLNIGSDQEKPRIDKLRSDKLRTDDFQADDFRTDEPLADEQYQIRELHDISSIKDVIIKSRSSSADKIRDGGIRLMDPLNFEEYSTIA